LWGWAWLAVASVVGPSMRVFTEGDESQLSDPTLFICSTITIARFHLFVREAASLASFWAAVNDANLGSIIKLGIVLAVEFRATDLRWFFTWLRWRRNLEINVKMFRAPVLRFAVFAISVFCEDALPVGVALEPAVTEVVLVMLFAEFMCVKHNAIPTIAGFDITRSPFTTVVNFCADLGAMLVVFLTSNIDAILSSTLLQKLLLRVLMKEDVQIALDLLGG